MALAVAAQSDSLFLSNGNIIVGELKDMVRGVATLETPYSDADFKIEWSEVRQVRTESTYLVQTVHGDRCTARLYSTDTAHVLMRGEADSASVLLSEIVYLKSVKTDFWSRASASIDFGYNYTKANNLQQYSARSGLGRGRQYALHLDQAGGQQLRWHTQRHGDALAQGHQGEG